MRALDVVLPEFDHHEVHAIELDADPERAVAAFLAAQAAPGRVVGMLFRLRGIRTRPTIEGLLTGIGFSVLSRSSSEVVIGGAGRPWTARGGIRALADARPGEVRVAVDVRASPLDRGRCVLSTETRIQAVDDEAREAFRKYWRVVGPFSGLVRRRWLRAARAIAQHD
ncbi:MAG TPA: hypothetical protein VFO26_02180 [Gaiella sp.]|uniref:hypothetical protein n=1 Tax=Gaiella sp. TaxID=2663207 RepID=UPI002D8103BC|nr:hypothetical protein [Gaiella sp.]HET9286342.1 hypothetical protein [Gaiella sp.]